MNSVEKRRQENVSPVRASVPEAPSFRFHPTRRSLQPTSHQASCTWRSIPVGYRLFKLLSITDLPARWMVQLTNKALTRDTYHDGLNLLEIALSMLS
jgi:hypothetical protein